MPLPPCFVQAAAAAAAAGRHLVCVLEVCQALNSYFSYALWFDLIFELVYLQLEVSLDSHVISSGCLLPAGA